MPVTTQSSGNDQLHLRFFAFRENRLPVTVRVRDPHEEPNGRIAFMKEPRSARRDDTQVSFSCARHKSVPPHCIYSISGHQASPICNLNVALPDSITPEVPGDPETISALQNKYGFLKGVGEASYYVKFDTIHRADLRISDIGNLLGPDWVNLAHELRIPDSDINIIKSEYPENEGNIGNENHVNESFCVLTLCWFLRHLQANRRW